MEKNEVVVTGEFIGTEGINWSRKNQLEQEELQQLELEEFVGTRNQLEQKHQLEQGEIDEQKELVLPEDLA